MSTSKIMEDIDQYRESACELISQIIDGANSSYNIIMNKLPAFNAAGVKYGVYYIADESLDKSNEVEKSRFCGIPVTIKSNISMLGYPVTIGISEQIATEDSVIVSTIRDLNGIIIAGTNCPQILLSFECQNPLVGKTVNPWDKTRTPGGSSGGEGALIASGISIIGVGTDIVGSIRCPAHFCGIAGFKPSSMRISQKGIMSPCTDNVLIKASVGFMARYSSDITYAMKLILCDKMFSMEDKIDHVLFNDSRYDNINSKIIGYYVAWKLSPRE